MGTPLGLEDMKTAVPFTRGGWLFDKSSRKTLIGKSFSARLRARRARPFFQVVIIKKMTVATAIGNHPPWKNFRRFAPKNARSKIKKVPTTAPAFHFGQCHVSVSTR